MATVTLSGVTTDRGGTDVLRDLDLVATAGAVLAIVGPSGSGKTSVLRTIAGLDYPKRGSIRFGTVEVTTLPPASRDVAMVFEAAALYPHKSVGKNIAFPLEMQHEDVDEIRSRVGAEARALHIERLLGESPKRLSTGEAHVVQVARAMVRRPAVLLLDEPFTHLDPELAARLRREVSLLQRGFEVTTVLATNDPIDALSMADRLAVIEGGRVTQTGAPLEVYAFPDTVAAANVTGDADVLEVVVEPDRDGSWLVHPAFRLRAWQPALRRHARRRLQMIVRPEWWELDEHGAVTVVVERSHAWGASLLLWCRAGGRPIAVKLPSPTPRPIEAGDELTLRLDRYVLIDPADGFALDLG